MLNTTLSDGGNTKSSRSVSKIAPQKAKFCSYDISKVPTTGKTKKTRFKSNKYSEVESFSPSKAGRTKIFFPFSIVADYFRGPFMQAMVEEANLQCYDIIPILPDKLLEHVITMGAILLGGNRQNFKVAVGSMMDDWLKQHGIKSLLKLNKPNGTKMFANISVLEKKLKRFDDVKGNNHDHIVRQIKELYDLGASLAKGEKLNVTSETEKLIPNCNALIENKSILLQFITIHDTINKAADGFFKSYVRKQPKLNLRNIEDGKKIDGVTCCRNYIFDELALMLNRFNYTTERHKDCNFYMAYPISRNPQSGALFKAMLTIEKLLGFSQKMVLLDIVFQKAAPKKQHIKQVVNELSTKMGRIEKNLSTHSFNASNEVKQLKSEIRMLKDECKKQERQNKKLKNEMREIKALCDFFKENIPSLMVSCKKFSDHKSGSVLSNKSSFYPLLKGNSTCSNSNESTLPGKGSVSNNNKNNVLEKKNSCLSGCHIL